MGSEINPGNLSVRVRKQHRDSNDSDFVLDLTLEVSAGITILFGPSGAGKSTLLDCIAGLVRPDAGRISVGDDVLVDSESGVHLAPQKRRLAYVFQELALFPHKTGEENVGYGLTNLPRKERNGRVEEILAAFHVEQLRKRKPSEMSGGEKRRVALARSLVTSPRVLLLDEPLTGLDTGLKAGIIDDLRAWNAAYKIPILYVTHSRDEVDALGEHVIAMHHGRVVGAGTANEILDAPRLKGLAQAVGFENLLWGTVVELRKPDGVMRVRGERSLCELEVPLGDAAPGSRVCIAVRAGDILLATKQPSALSARNIMEGQIVSLEQRGTMVIARVNCGMVFIVHVTPGAARTLELCVERKVWLVLKTHSCHLVAA
ncbi:MAG TPA: molybdenum ABC transporter ATP-binding protein [Candidatus Dormibacteraeota bacterium]|nr:molybdenum ABC transporter ATP-binding protein [Candidatus Dormibacteraeota bacterium]